MRSLLVIAFLMAGSFVFADSLSSCPDADLTHHYVVTKLRADQEGERAGAIKLYYQLAKPYDASKPTLLMINGGPGGDSNIIHSLNPDGELAQKFNLVSWDHRGLGCTQILSSVVVVGNEKGLLGMSRSADDVEAVRKDLLGENGRWSVYGVSYGTFLGQTYITKYPDHIDKVILDSAMDNWEGVGIARAQFVALFIRSDAKISQMFDQLVSLNPDLREQILLAIQTDAYSFLGRTAGIEHLFQALLAAPDREKVIEILNAQPRMEAPMIGMVRQIICEEIWDYSGDHSANQYYWKAFADDCGPFSTYRHGMDFRQTLQHLPMRVFIWGGAFDPVTPIQSMREMHKLIPHSLLWENGATGHCEYCENEACAERLGGMFMSGSSDDEIQSVANSADCQKAAERKAISSFDFYRRYVSPSPLF